MPRMTGGAAVVRALVDHGVDTVFAIPGIQLDHLFNALHDARNAIRVVHTRHEQGAAYMAMGFAQATGRPGVYAVVPGPGVLNTTAALATAYATGAPVFCLTGQIPSHAIGRGFGLLHEIPDQLGVLRGLTKWAARIDHPAHAPRVMREAFRELASGRVRPVAVEIAMDLLARAAEVAPLAPAAPDPAPWPDPDAIEALAKLLGAAERPLIFAGGGAVGCGAELLALSELLQAPVALSRGSLGVIDGRSPFAITHPAAHRLWGDADVVLGVGTRLQQQVPGWGLDAGIKIARIDVDPVEVARAGRPAVAVVADARPALSTLLERLPRHNRKRPSRVDDLVRLKAGVERTLRERVRPQMAYIDALRAELPEDGFFVEDLTQVGYVARFAFPVHRPRSYIHTGYQGTLGFGFATALGVKAAFPGRAVVSIAGDGGFMYNVQELATAVQHGLGVVTVIFNDGAYGNVRRMQVEDHGGRVIASDLKNPDFVRLAESFGAHGLRAQGPEELRAALRRALATPGPTLIDVPVGDFPAPWEFLQPPPVRPKPV
jgi:acetolactate synthase-1/2/3 large subunit